MANPMDFGDKQYDYGAGYPAPFSIPDETACRTFKIPASDENGEWLALVMGLMMTLTFPENWVQFEGAIERDDAATRWQEMIDEAYAEADFGCPVTTVDTPFWDTDEDVDDEVEIDEQDWYGYVEDAEAPPGELLFVEDAAIWAFTGLLAVGTGSLPLAIAFRTIAPKMVIAVRTGDFASIVRIVIDGEEAARVDTTGHAPGEVINVPIIGNPENEEHQIYLIKAG